MSSEGVGSAAFALADAARGFVAAAFGFADAGRATAEDEAEAFADGIVDDGVVDEMGACVTASAMPTTPSTNSTSIDPVPTPTVSPIQLTITNPTISPIEQNPSSTASASFKRLSSSFTVFQFLSSLLFMICL